MHTMYYCTISFQGAIVTKIQRKKVVDSPRRGGRQSTGAAVGAAAFRKTRKRPDSAIFGPGVFRRNRVEFRLDVEL